MVSKNVNGPFEPRVAHIWYDAVAWYQLIAYESVIAKTVHSLSHCRYKLFLVQFSQNGVFLCNAANHCILTKELFSHKANLIKPPHFISVETFILKGARQRAS